MYKQEITQIDKITYLRIRVIPTSQLKLVFFFQRSSLNKINLNLFGGS
jgi:hypothetical protein